MAILAIPISIVVFGFIFVYFTQPVNMLIDGFNNLISTNTISVQTYDYFGSAIDLLKASPYFMLIGLSLYTLERSKGTDIPIQTYMSYLFLMITCIILSILLVMVFGSLIDVSMEAIANAQYMNVPEKWNTFYKTNFVIKVMYYGCLAPGYCGSILYMFHPVIKQLGNIISFNSSEPEETEYEPQYNLKQF